MKTILKWSLKLLLLFFTIFYSCNKENKGIWTIDSPDKKIRVEIKKDPADQILKYYVKLKEEGRSIKIIDQSKLGIEREDTDLYNDLKFISKHFISNQKDEYKMVSGNRNEYYNLHNEIRLKFKNKEDKIIDIVFRVFNNGLAFRYEFPKDNLKTIRITKEYSSFKFNDGFMWGNPYDTISQWSSGYETYLIKKAPIGSSAPKNKNGWAFPLLFETKGHWALISESNLNASYEGSHLESVCKNGEYKIRFAEAKEARGFYSNSSTITIPGKTPWRFISIGRNLSDIVESHLVTDLAEPCILDDTGWIKPGRATWSWWSESDSPKDYKKLIPYIDLAAKMGWEYSLIDANWNNMQQGSIEKLSKYASNKNVGLLLWYNSGGKHNIISEEPRDLMYDRKIRQKEFERISKLGIKGIKVDFFQSDKQKIIQQYIEILEDAAKYHLIVNFHGCTLPRGWRKTYPNLLSMEAIKGAENYKYDAKYPERSPSLITTIPFLRGVAGPTDYTPLTFSNNKYPHLTTTGFELALPVIIENGILHCSENYKVLENQPNFVKDLLKEIPVTWDEIKYLSGYPGKDIILAKRKGDKWFIAGINGENKSKTYKLNLSKLNLKTYKVDIFSNQSKNNELRREEIIINDKTIKLNILPFGGFIGVTK